MYIDVDIHEHIVIKGTRYIYIYMYICMYACTTSPLPELWGKMPSATPYATS